MARTVPLRTSQTHVVILDGTLSRLDRVNSTNAGRIWELLRDGPAASRPNTFYEEGLQWQDWKSLPAVIAGRGLNRQIRRAYAFLAASWRPGDRIFLFGYSRGAFAVRSLAGLIDRIGLLMPHRARPAMIEALYRHYRDAPDSPRARAFARRFCHPRVPVEMVGVFDTVKALGWRLPGLHGRDEAAHGFHNHALGRSVRHGYHALALQERRVAYTPVLWETPDDWPGHVEQVWFRGNHGDVGGQLAGFSPARPLANIPLVWMLQRAERCGLALPPGWADRFDRDPQAPSTGPLRGWSKIFVQRKIRTIGADPSERIHPSARHVLPRRAADVPLAEAPQEAHRHPVAG